MKKIKFKTYHKKILSDKLTPVSIYLKLRDRFANSLLLESSDYDANNKNFSYICCEPIASISVRNREITYTYPGQKKITTKFKKNDSLPLLIEKFSKKFDYNNKKYSFITNGLFGYISHEAISHFEDHDLDKNKDNLEIPDLYYAVYKYIICVSLFNHEAHIFCHSINDKNDISIINKLLINDIPTNYSFTKNGEKVSNFTDKEFTDLVKKGKNHCFRGDVFQIVLSRRFSQSFYGDEFNVYRALRSINPSPYLFFFDYGSFKIFGSSPEAQIIIENGRAEIHPIAGTFKRTGNDTKDKELAEKLKKDPKENSEHVMLVDLARNDLSRNGTEVRVEKNRQIQFFSHVIHLVSKVTGKLNPLTNNFQVVADTFPAGTLSGAPKHMALKLIDKYENVARNFYGGALGYFDFEGNFNHCIIIRSFLSKNQIIYYQAGAGVVAKSKPKKELEEVYNKLGALEKALEMAEKIT
ncbi:MAG: anthranilate synthase component I family protein [Flavobacteriaceae bacterium]